jgi:hypothetical protein
MKNFNTLDRELSIKDSKMKYITVDNNNFDNFLLFGKKLKNGEINQDNMVHYAKMTRTNKSLKESEEYWDNTKRKQLDTSTYINNPNKVQGNGFGNISEYNLFFNGIGLSTRQTKPDEKPNNIDNDRIFLTNHNYNNDKYHIISNLPRGGTDTRILNKKII